MSNRGRLTNEIQPTKLVFGQHSICPTCKGKRIKKKQPCGACNGSGVVG